MFTSYGQKTTMERGTLGKELNKLKRRKEALRRFEEINVKRSMSLIVHYSCESFYEIKDGRTPRVTSIAVKNFNSGQTTSFSIHKSAELAGVPLVEVTNEYDRLEKSMLDEFFTHLRAVPHHTFIHWNMRDTNYGFQAIEHRYKTLGGDPAVVDDARKFDLARELINLYGPGYAPHGESGRLHSLMKLNHITAKDALTGKEEADAFDNQEYVKLHQSTLRKVDVMNNILDRTLDGSLKTTSSWRDRYGLHPAALLEVAQQHWIWGLLVAAGVLITISMSVWPWLGGQVGVGE